MKTKYRFWKSAVRMVMYLSLFQAACVTGCLSKVARNINPCGTILNCDPVTYRFIQSGYQGPGADPAVDPSCTYPPFCADDPFVATQATQGG